MASTTRLAVFGHEDAAFAAALSLHVSYSSGNSRHAQGVENGQQTRGTGYFVKEFA